MARTPSVSDPARLEAQLKDIVRKIREDEDPHDMNAYRRFVRRNVSVFHRAYFTAWLVKQIDEGGLVFRDAPADDGPRRRRGRGGRGERKERQREREGRDVTGSASGEHSDAGAEQSTTAEGMKTLFIGIGKNRRIYPKDLIALVEQVEGVDADSLDQIKVLDNYSFVDVPADRADRIIEVCSGKEVRGRKVTVSYARPRK